MALIRENDFLESLENVRCKRIQFHLEGNITDSEWKDYCPEAFRYIQELDEISQADYSVLLCSNDILKEVTLPGKCGHVFVLSNDDRLAIKTLRKCELKAILEMFKSYYFHLLKNPTSLLVRIYGLHSVKLSGGLKVYFLVFGNPAQIEENATDCYHLKGISTGRKQNVVKFEDYVLHKDNDFGYQFYLHPAIREKLLQQIISDCSYLEAEGRMDYFLALAVAFPPANETTDSISDDDDIFPLQSSSDAHINFYNEVATEIDRNGFVFGRGMPALAIRRRKISEMGSTREIRTTEYFNVVLYFEIMDIFKKYSVIKRIEHLYKTFQYDTKSVSTANPKEYSSRFLEFAQQIFLPADS